MKFQAISRKESGQLMLPMLGLLFMFGLFLAAYIQWCRHKYWVLRLDIAAQATALSAVRTQAEILNTLGTIQLAENALVQKGTLDGITVGFVQDSSAGLFQGCLRFLRLTFDSFQWRVPLAAELVARNNIPDSIAVPLTTNFTPDIRWQPINVVYVYGIYPDGFDDVSEGYLARGWGQDSRVAQPDPESAMKWTVYRNSQYDYASARLWLDVTNDAPLVNGGFPRVNDTVLGGLGIQCFYPQFNARLVTRTRQIKKGPFL